MAEASKLLILTRKSKVSSDSLAYGRRARLTQVVTSAIILDQVYLPNLFESETNQRGLLSLHSTRRIH